jgi:hypothetical protein
LAKNLRGRREARRIYKEVLRICAAAAAAVQELVIVEEEACSILNEVGILISQRFVSRISML